MEDKIKKLNELAKECEELSRRIRKSKLPNPYRRIYRLEEKKYSKYSEFLKDLKHKPE